MIRSMTGFGRGEYRDDRKSVTVEIRAVNHRYCDIYVKMPRRYSFAEDKLKNEIKKKLYRGKIEVSVMVDSFGETDTDVRLDKELAAKYYSVLSELEGAFDFSGSGSGISVGLLARMPEVIVNTSADEDEDEFTGCLLKAAAEATSNICAMREVEGAKLAEDLMRRADIVEDIRSRIEERAPKIQKEYAAKFRERIEELLEGTAELPEERVALEAAVFADKANITEELVRLDSHVQQLRLFLSSSEGAIGKKTDFLVQEMNREANTIGSKSNDREITSMMLDLKAEIEKIREQVQNIE